MHRSFIIKTLGCKVNQYESEFLRESLLAAGWQDAHNHEPADLIVVNTCIVTQKASYQSRQAIRKAIRENPSARVAAVGCYAQVFPEELAGIEGLKLIAGNSVKPQLADILSREADPGNGSVISEGFPSHPPYPPQPIKGFFHKTRAFLKIQDGCESFCSYCIVPFARGPLRSLPIPGVISVLETLTAEGYQEVVLTGVHLGKYGADLQPGTNLPGLLHQIGRRGLPLRIRLSSLEPTEIDPDLIEMMSSTEWLCRHLHIPLQSADDQILKQMNRRYTARAFASLVDHLHDRIPFIAIGIDVMVGFPGEDGDAFQNTYSLLRDLPVSYLHVFPFSPRKGTPAEKFSGRIDPQVTRQRASLLRHLGQEKKISFYRSCLGKRFMVLTEGWRSPNAKFIKGLSDNYLPVIFPSRQLLKNHLVPVQLEEMEKNHIRGRLV